MPRPRRQQIAGGIYHVTARGNNRRALFLDDDDRQLFLKILAGAVKRYEWRCYAYCLMRNHFHLLVETPQPNIAAGMSWLNSSYSRTFNRLHGRVGHLFQSRYGAQLIESEAYVAEASRYIVLNPVRAGAVRHPGDTPWSSYLAMIGAVPTPTFLTCGPVLELLASDPREARRAFEEYVAEALADVTVAGSEARVA
jgi:putative transposase